MTREFVLGPQAGPGGSSLSSGKASPLFPDRASLPHPTWASLCLF